MKKTLKNFEKTIKFYKCFKFVHQRLKLIKFLSYYNYVLSLSLLFNY